MSKYIKPLMVASIAMSQLALPGFSHAASRVFFDNFESGKASSTWNYMECPVVTRAQDGGAPRQSNYMLQCGWNGAVPWNHTASMVNAELNSWPYAREMFLRMWIRLDQNMDYKDGAKLFRLGFGGDCQFVMQRDPATQNGGTHEVIFCGPRKELIIVNAWGPHVFEDHQWHKLEIYIKHDTNGTDGEVKVWKDGKLTTCCGYPYKGRTTWSSRTRWYPLNLTSNWSSNPGWEHDANNNWYIDDIEIYSDQGTGATGSMANATITTSGPPSSVSPLKVPSNLRVVQ